MTAELSLRTARCAYCHTERPSDRGLAFFEDRSPGSNFTQRTCAVCRYAPAAHEPVNPYTGRPPSPPCAGHAFTPHPGFEHDGFYCGCRGWD